MLDRVLADIVLFLHAIFVLFIVLGLVAVLAGGALRWKWVGNPWFRWGHLVAILFVIAETWLGVTCPLTDIETRLRVDAGDETYRGGFVAHWLHELLFIDAPAWAFAVAYTAFGALVVASWFLVRPRRFSVSRHRRRAA